MFSFVGSDRHPVNICGQEWIIEIPLDATAAQDSAFLTLSASLQTGFDIVEIQERVKRGETISRSDAATFQGESKAASQVACAVGILSFTPPSGVQGPDWPVLIDLDSARKRFQIVSTLPPNVAEEIGNIIAKRLWMSDDDKKKSENSSLDSTNTETTPRPSKECELADDSPDLSTEQVA